MFSFEEGSLQSIHPSACTLAFCFSFFFAMQEFTKTTNQFTHIPYLKFWAFIPIISPSGDAAPLKTVSVIHVLNSTEQQVARATPLPPR